MMGSRRWGQTIKFASQCPLVRMQTCGMGKNVALYGLRFDSKNCFTLPVLLCFLFYCLEKQKFDKYKVLVPKAISGARRVGTF